ncbi:MAG: IS4 family transposase [Burkholderiaceae bacterium]
MFRISTFQTLLKGLPRDEFERLVRKHNGDKYCKRFRHWNHLVAMTYAQLGGVTGLRPLETSFNSHVAHHYHLGVDCLKRATLADANETRGDAVFADAAAWLMQKVSRQLRQQTRELLYLLDSTSITLKGREFDRWTLANRTRRTQGIKLHVLYAQPLHAPVWQCMSAANVNDVAMASDVPLQEGAQYVFDKGYCDYNWWHRIDQAGAVFVTRFKRNAGLRVEQERTIPAAAAGIVLQDRIVRFKYKHQGGKRINRYDKPLRCITIVRADRPTPLVLATNDLTSEALEIAQRYKQRWDIELFFKWIKQHLKIRKFLGRTENAVRIQLLTALISYLLVALYRQTHGLKQTLWTCLCQVRATLFQRPDSDASKYRKRRQHAELMARIQKSLF